MDKQESKYIMTERTVVTTQRRQIERPINQEFQFDREMIPTPGGDGESPSFLREYRQRAWQAFEQLPMPKTTDEPWRRTDLRGLKAGSFRIPEPDEYKNLPSVPNALLEPMAGDKYGGQIVLLPGDVQVELSDQLSSKGVIFTDLVTAERKNADILAHIIGQTVRYDEGK